MDPIEKPSPDLAETLRILREQGVVSCELYESGALKIVNLGPLDVAGSEDEDKPKVQPDGVRASLVSLANRGRRSADGGARE